MKLIFEKSVPGRRCTILPACDVETAALPESLRRSDKPDLPQLSETDISRHYTELCHQVHGVNCGFYPLGSCTMKYNPRIDEEMAALPGFTGCHPLAPRESLAGMRHVLDTAQEYLCQITGMDGMTFQPAAGAHGEFTGVLLIKQYHDARGDHKRTKIIVPDSAHGTNPATAAMCGYEVVNIASGPDGCVDLDSLRSALGDDTAGLMLTNPNTVGIFDKNILEITRLVHEAGGLCYYDGANLNAVMGIVRPGDMGFDCIHMNLHKTFATPHGGGGPGAGAVGCKAFLTPYLPHSASAEEEGHIQVRSFMGNFLVVVRALTYLLTRNVTKTLSVLMVDFSCALKLAIPIAVLSAMRECSGHHISVKGGRFMEAVAQADTIVFDKTGTLTYATPRVAEIVPFGGRDPQEMLRLAACLEEHYPHSMANAVVEEARARGLSHEEYHSQVQYVVAHGISSMVEGEKVLIGSAHFVFEDEGCRVPEGEDEKFRTLSPAYSHLYLCIAGELAAVICIHDPLRREARDAVAALHACGIGKVVMMTGDNRQTAQAVARAVGVDAVYAEVLPEDKAAFIRSEKAAGHTVIMVGDGVNDSPALSEADAGVAISTGAAIAREIADITIASEDLFELVTLRRLSQALMARIHRNYRFIVGFNLSLILLGVAGLLPPTTSALLHNMSTLGISLKSMTDLGPELPSPTPAER